MRDCAFTGSIDECIFSDGNRAWSNATSCKHFRKHIFCKYYESLKDLENGGSGAVIDSSDVVSSLKHKGGF